jgi:hypothetical protein
MSVEVTCKHWLKEDSPSHRSGALFPGDQIHAIQGWEVPLFTGWDSLGYLALPS